MTGPKKGSEGAQRISDAHRGGHEHDKRGGFACDPKLAAEAGRISGETVFARRGRRHYREIGIKGGLAKAEMLRRKKEKS